MIAWLDPALAHVKALHVASLGIWCAGLFALPLMLGRHDPAIGQDDYDRIRRATHYGYTYLVTPSALLAIATGALLIFVRDAFVTWMFAKLSFVALLVTFHAWVGHVLVAVAETEGAHVPPEPTVPLLLLLVPIVAVLALVLGKPDLTVIPLPGWLQEPWGVQLPFDVPRW